MRTVCQIFHAHYNTIISNQKMEYTCDDWWENQ